MDRGRLSVIACDSGKVFGDRVIAALHEKIRSTAERDGLANDLVESEIETIQLRKRDEVWFASGEVKTQIQENVRGDDVYVVQNFHDPNSNRSINDELMALLTAVNAAHQSDAEWVTAVVPLYPYSRQERKRGREGITAAQVANFIESSGADRVLTLDVHAEAVAGAFRLAKFENLRPYRVIVDHLKKNYDLTDFVIVSPDAGGAERARTYAKHFRTAFSLIDKVRDYDQPNIVKEVRLVGKVEGHNVLVVDDMIDTGGSLMRTLQTIRERGANDVYICCTHAILSDKAVERLDKAYETGIIKKLIATDSVVWGQRLADRAWYEEVSVAHLFASVIKHVNQGRSVSALLG